MDISLGVFHRITAKVTDRPDREIMLVSSGREHAFRTSTLALRYDPKVEFDVVRVTPQVTYQRLLGFGAAVTEAAASVYAQMPTELQKRLVEQAFGPEGNRYTLARTSIQSSDFGLGSYAYVRRPWDKRLGRFDMTRDRETVIPLLQAATAQNSQLEVLASPWSPPAFMKTNRLMVLGGHLRHRCRGMWAWVMARYAQEMRDQGIAVTRMTLQNEPRAVQTWESCLYDTDEMVAFAPELRAALDAAGLQDVKLLGWDHNKERLYDYAAALYGSVSSLDGMAFHWYTGDHFEVLAEVARRWPDQELIMTEGCEAFSTEPADRFDHALHYAHDVMGDLNAGAHAWIDWNLVLDERGGPNHVGNFCSAPISYDRTTQELRFLPSFTYLGHFSRYILPGATRVMCSRPRTGLEATAWRNPSGELVVVVLSTVDGDQDYVLSLGDYAAKITCGPHEIQTLVISGE